MKAITMGALLAMSLPRGWYSPSPGQDTLRSRKGGSGAVLALNFTGVVNGISLVGTPRRTAWPAA